MDTSKKSVVSMLTSADKITLFTLMGEVISIPQNGTYDMGRIVEFLTPKINGMTAVEIDLGDFTLVGAALKSMEVESEGIVVVQVIDGKEVQGIFYPQKTSVVVQVGEDKVTIPDVENLVDHMRRAADDKSPSVVNFFKRIAPVIQARKHSGEDLMKFIKRSELPLTNDGRIIAYKRVNRESDHFFKDCHTGKVKQRIGSRVTMPVDLVDPSRHNSCSTGLHVCNLGYLKGFGGSDTLVVLVNPEDFIAVPHGEDTKARVCSYDVVALMDGKNHIQSNSGKSVESASFESAIAAIVRGDIPEMFELVSVGKRGDTTITSIAGATKGKMAPKSKAVVSGKPLTPSVAENIDLIQTARDAKTQASGVTIPPEVERVFQMLVDGVSKSEAARAAETSTRSIGRWIEKYGDPVELAKVAAARKAAEAEVADPTNTVPQQAKRLFMLGRFEELKALKKAKKKSWISLGFTEAEIGQIEKAA